jgi:hypothetical protein
MGNGGGSPGIEPLPETQALFQPLKGIRHKELIGGHEHVALAAPPGGSRLLGLVVGRGRSETEVRYGDALGIVTAQTIHAEVLMGDGGRGAIEEPASRPDAGTGLHRIGGLGHGVPPVVRAGGKQ